MKILKIQELREETGTHLLGPGVTPFGLSFHKQVAAIVLPIAALRGLDDNEILNHIKSLME